MNFIRKSITARAILPIAAVIAIITIGAVYTVAQIMAESNTAAIKEKAKMMGLLMADAAVPAVWDLNPKVATNLLNSLAIDEDFVGGSIAAGEDKSFASVSGHEQ